MTTLHAMQVTKIPTSRYMWKCCDI